MTDWPMFYATVALGALNLLLLGFVFHETRRTRGINERLASIEQNRDRAILEFDVAAEGKNFREDDDEVWIFFRVLNRGGKDTELWPKNCTLEGFDANGDPVPLPYNVWATEEMRHMQRVKNKALNALDPKAVERRKRDPDDYLIRVGRMTEFWARIYNQGDLRRVASNRVRFTIAPVIGDPVTTEITMATLLEAAEYLRRTRPK